MCAVEELIYNDQIVLQLHRSKQSSPQEKLSSDILQFAYGLPILFINTNINEHPRL